MTGRAQAGIRRLVTALRTQLMARELASLQDLLPDAGSAASEHQAGHPGRGTNPWGLIHTVTGVGTHGGWHTRHGSWYAWGLDYMP